LGLKGGDVVLEGGDLLRVKFLSSCLLFEAACDQGVERFWVVTHVEGRRGKEKRKEEKAKKKKEEKERKKKKRKKKEEKKEEKEKRRKERKRNKLTVPFGHKRWVPRCE